MTTLIEKKRDLLKLRSVVLLAMATWGILIVCHSAGVFDILNLRLGDVRYRIRGTRQASDEIVIVEVDDRTVEAFAGTWPLRRDLYAYLLSTIGSAGARAIAVDLLFSDEKDADTDSLLALVTSTTNPVVHATDLLGIEDRHHPLPPSLPEWISWENSASAWAPRADRAVPPLPRLLRHTRHSGHVNITIDKDDVIRRLYPLIEYQDRLFPSLGLAAVQVARGEWPSSVSGTRSLTTVGTTSPVRIPLDRDGAARIDFAGGPEAFPVRTSMLDVLQGGQGGEQEKLRQLFGDRIVLVGSTANDQAAADLGSIPLARQVPRMYLHANAIDAFLGGHFLRPIPRWFHGGLLLLLAIIIGFGMSRLTLPAAGGLVLAGTMVMGFGIYAAFAFGHLDVPPTELLGLPLGLYVVFASEGFRALRRKAEEKERELHGARAIQTRLLPDTPPNSSAFDIWGVNLAAKEVGGDYYDWIERDDGRISVVVGDVCGKGAPAAILMSHLRATCHDQFRNGVNLSTAVAAMNESLYRATSPMHFATFIAVGLDPGNGAIEFCNAGHNPGYIVGPSGCRELKSSAPPLGVSAGMVFPSEQTSFDSGETLILYSDGVTESTRTGEFFGEKRLRSLAEEARRAGLSASATADRILKQVREFSDSKDLSDDVTLLVVRRK